MTYSRFEVRNSQVEENLFINLGWNSMDVDTRTSGFFRNNRIIRFGSQVDKSLADPVIRFRGDINRASGGNTIAGGAFLGIPAIYFDNQFSLNLLGPGDESYVTVGFPFLKIGPMGHLNVWQSFGLMASGTALDCEADEAVIFAFDQKSATKPVIRLGPSQGSALILNNTEPDLNVVDENPKGF